MKISFKVRLFTYTSSNHISHILKPVLLKSVIYLAVYRSSHTHAAILQGDRANKHAPSSLQKITLARVSHVQHYQVCCVVNPLGVCGDRSDRQNCQLLRNVLRVLTRTMVLERENLFIRNKA